MGNGLTSQASPEDVTAVTCVATEYFQSWFAGDGERMRACLHPALAKRRAQQPGTETLGLLESPKDQLVEGSDDDWYLVRRGALEPVDGGERTEPGDFIQRQRGVGYAAVGETWLDKDPYTGNDVKFTLIAGRKDDR